MKGERKHSIARRLAIVGFVLVLLVVGLVTFRGGTNPKPTMTVTLLSEVDLGTNRVATLVLSNAGPGSIAFGAWRTNIVDGWLDAYASTGKINTTEIRLSIIPPFEILEPGETFRFVETIPATAKKWRFNTEGRDPRRADRIMVSPALVKAFGIIDDLPLPDAFLELVRGQSKWTLDIQSPWFGPDSVSNDTD
jgi:hypothetical protein